MKESHQNNGISSAELEEKGISQGIQGFNLLCIAISSVLLALDKIDNTNFISLSAIWATIYLTCHFPIGSIAELKLGKLSIKKDLKEAKSTLKEIKKIGAKMKEAALKIATLNHMIACNALGLQHQGSYQTKFLSELDNLISLATNEDKDKIEAFEEKLQKIQTLN